MFETYFSENNLETLMIELTSRCQLRCRRCERTQLLGNHKNSEQMKYYQSGPNINPNGGFDPKADVSLETIKKLVPKRPILVEFTGAFGDAIYHPDLQAIVKYLLQETPVRIRLETNGSGRSAQWWKELRAAITNDGNNFNDRVTIVFSIDGLKDTNHLYRIGSNWDSIMEGVSQLAGSCQLVWKYILFSHNEHQIQDAKAMFKNIGFTELMFVDSRRYNEWWASIDEQCEIKNGIDPLKPNILAKDIE